MKRRYILNGFEERREYFLKVLGNITSSEFNILKNGETLEKDGNKFTIENYWGL